LDNFNDFEGCSFPTVFPYGIGMFAPNESKDMSFIEYCQYLKAQYRPPTAVNWHLWADAMMAALPEYAQRHPQDERLKTVMPASQGADEPKQPTGESGCVVG